MEHLGLVGLPDSGHDGVFAALTGHDTGHAAERLLGSVAIPDERLDRLAEMSASKQVVRATFQIAWLPALSTEAGKGLGSRFLGSLPRLRRPAPRGARRCGPRTGPVSSPPSRRS